MSQNLLSGIFQAIAAVKDAVAAMETGLTQFHAAQQSGQPETAIGAGAQAVENVANVVEGAAPAITTIGALAGAPGDAAAAAINAAAPLVAGVAADVAKEFATPIADGTPVAIAIDYIERLDAVLGDVIGGTGTAENIVVNAAWDEFKKIFASHSAAVA